MNPDNDFTLGAEVAVGSGSETRLGVVDRLTRTQILVRFHPSRDPVRYRKDDLRQVGAGTWARNVHVRLATEEDRIEVEWRRVRHRAAALSKDPEDRRTAALQLREGLDSFLARTYPHHATSDLAALAEVGLTEKNTEKEN